MTTLLTQNNQSSQSGQPSHIRLFDNLPCSRCGKPAFFAFVASADVEGQEGSWIITPLCDTCHSFNACLLPAVTEKLTE